MSLVPNSLVIATIVTLLVLGFYLPRFENFTHLAVGILAIGLFVGNIVSRFRTREENDIQD